MSLMFVYVPVARTRCTQTNMHVHIHVHIYHIVRSENSKYAHQNKNKRIANAYKYIDARLPVSSQQATAWKLAPHSSAPHSTLIRLRTANNFIALV